MTNIAMIMVALEEVSLAMQTPELLEELDVAQLLDKALDVDGAVTEVGARLAPGGVGRPVAGVVHDGAQRSRLGLEPGDKVEDSRLAGKVGRQGHHAATAQLVEFRLRHLVERLPRCGDLGDDVAALAVLLQHRLDSANLTLHTAQSLAQVILHVRCDFHGHFLPKPRNPRFAAARFEGPSSLHRQRCAAGTSPSTCSTWAPHPAQDGFLQVEQVVLLHIPPRVSSSP